MCGRQCDFTGCLECLSGNQCFYTDRVVEFIKDFTLLSFQESYNTS